MKKISYYENEYLLTDKEFAVALESWGNSINYYCQRLEVMLPPTVRFAETPREEFGRKIYILRGEDPRRRFFRGNGKYFEILQGGAGALEYQFIDADHKTAFEKKLISQENYYDFLPGGLGIDEPKNVVKEDKKHGRKK